MSVAPMTLTGEEKGMILRGSSYLHVWQPDFDLGTPVRPLFGFSRPSEAVSTTIARLCCCL